MVTVQVSSAVKSQQDFLARLCSSSPVSNTSCSTFSTSAADLARPAFNCTSTAAPPAASCPQLQHPVGSRTGTQQQPFSSLTAGLCPSLGAGAGQVQLGGSLSAGASPAHAPPAASLPAGDSSAALLLLRQLAQLQQLMQQQQQPLQPQVTSMVPQQLQKPTAVAGTGGKHSSSSSAGGAAAPAAAAVLANLDKGRLQQLARHLQERKLQQHGSSGISRVSSDLTQMLALSVSMSSEDSDAVEDGTSVVGN